MTSKREAAIIERIRHAAQTHIQLDQRLVSLTIPHPSRFQPVIIIQTVDVASFGTASAPWYSITVRNSYLATDATTDSLTIGYGEGASPELALLSLATSIGLTMTYLMDQHANRCADIRRQQAEKTYAATH